MSMTLKVVAVGDCSSNKSGVLTRLGKSLAPPGQEEESYSDTLEATVEVLGHRVTIQFIDTTGQESFVRMRALVYPKTDLFLLCFSFLDSPSLSNLKDNWYPELLSYCPTTAIYVVGTDHDQPEEASAGMMSSDHVRALVDELKHNIIGYRDVSITTGIGAKELLTHALSIIVPKKVREQEAEAQQQRTGDSPPSTLGDRQTLRFGKQLLDKARSTLRRHGKGSAAPTSEAEAAATPPEASQLASSCPQETSSSDAAPVPTEGAQPQTAALSASAPAATGTMGKREKKPSSFSFATMRRALAQKRAENEHQRQQQHATQQSGVATQS